LQGVIKARKWGKFKEVSPLTDCVIIDKIFHFLGFALYSALCSDNKYTFPIFFDERGKASKKFLIRSIPTTFIINSEGIIVKKKLGAEDWSNLDVESLIINKETKKGDGK